MRKTTRLWRHRIGWHGKNRQGQFTASAGQWTAISRYDATVSRHLAETFVTGQSRIPSTSNGYKQRWTYRQSQERERESMRCRSGEGWQILFCVRSPKHKREFAYCRAQSKGGRNRMRHIQERKNFKAWQATKAPDVKTLGRKLGAKVRAFPQDKR